MNLISGTYHSCEMREYARVLNNHSYTMKHFLLSLYLSLKAHMTQHIKQIRKKEGNKLKERDKIKRDIKQTNKKRLSLGQNRNGHATRTVTMKGGRRTIFIVMVTTAMRVSATHFVLFFIYLFIIIIIIIIHFTFGRPHNTV